MRRSASSTTVRAQGRPRRPIIVAFINADSAEIRIPYERPIECFNVPEVLPLARKIGRRVNRPVEVVT